jgi:hypothetical protein
MRLNVENLTIQEQLQEFDQWLTARLDRIKIQKSLIMKLHHYVIVSPPYLLS